MQTADIAEWVRRAQAGDQQAVAELYRCYRPRVLQFLYARTGDRELAEDLTQETFIRALRSLKTYDPERGAKFVSWLFTVARNLCVDAWRKRQGRTEIAAGIGADLDVWASGGAGSRSPEALVVRHEECARLLSSVPAEMAAAVALTQACGFKVAEVAVRLGIPEGTVKSRTHNGLRLMAQPGVAQ